MIIILICEIFVWAACLSPVLFLLRMSRPTRRKPQTNNNEQAELALRDFFREEK